MNERPGIIEIITAILLGLGVLGMVAALGMLAGFFIFCLPALGLWFIYNIPFHYIFGAPYVSYWSMLFLCVILCAIGTIVHVVFNND